MFGGAAVTQGLLIEQHYTAALPQEDHTHISDVTVWIDKWAHRRCGADLKINK